MKIVWETVVYGKLELCARMYYDDGSMTMTGLRDTDMDPVQDWCVQNKCGRRTSFDTFKFRDKKELAFFLLKWG